MNVLSVEIAGKFRISLYLLKPLSTSCQYERDER